MTRPDAPTLATSWWPTGDRLDSGRPAPRGAGSPRRGPGSEVTPRAAGVGAGESGPKMAAHGRVGAGAPGERGAWAAGPAPALLPPPAPTGRPSPGPACPAHTRCFCAQSRRRRAALPVKGQRAPGARTEGSGDPRTRGTRLKTRPPGTGEPWTPPSHLVASCSPWAMRLGLGRSPRDLTRVAPSWGQARFCPGGRWTVR